MLKKLGFKKVADWASDDYIDAQIPFSEKKKLYRQDVESYAKRKPASPVRHIGGLGAVGGLIGGVISRGKPVGIAAGTGLGALVGKFTQTQTDKNTAAAKDLLSGGEPELRKALLWNIRRSNMQQKQVLEDIRTHQILGTASDMVSEFEASI